MNTKTAGLITFSIIAIFIFLFGVWKLTSSGGDTAYKDMLTIASADHVKWNPKAKHIMVEYSDLECPACRLMHESLKSIEASSSPYNLITKNVAFVYRNYPLYQIHPNAYATAYAVEAAGKQGKFFEMLDLIFADQAALEKTTDINAFLNGKASKLSLDPGRFAKDRDDKTVKDKIDADMGSGDRGGLSATPTFYLDGKKLDSMAPEALLKLLQSLN